jgi:hypothetical protein
MTPKTKATLAIEALDAACKHIQDQIGQDDGGVAAIFFSGTEGETIVNHFLKYIELELSFSKVAA